MSRSTVVLLLVLCAAIAGLIVFQKMRTKQAVQIDGSPSSDTTTVAGKTPNPAAGNTTTTPGTPRIRPLNGENRTAVAIPSITERSNDNVSRTTIAAANPATVGRAPLPIQPIVEPLDDLTPKPLPVMEKEYFTATNRDVRLDLMMDIADTSNAEAVKTLTRLFEVETDTDLKVDLLDSLLGIEGFKEEKLIMLTLGARQGLPNEVRQSAIDGLIDLDDRRAIPVLNGLLNDPDEEIREGAKDALEMLQSQPAVQLKQ
jgi:hypothetical protein